MLNLRIVTPVLVLAAGALALSATSTSSASGAAYQDPGMERPSAHHKRVLQGVGEWQGTMTSLMPGMPQEPVAARAWTEAVGGFWTRTRMECSFMGMPYVGAGSAGYIAQAKKYVATWTDSVSSYFALMEGDYDEQRDLLVMRWEAPDETGKVRPHHYELAMQKDSYTCTFFVGAGQEAKKSMVIQMKRKPKQAAK